MKENINRKENRDAFPATFLDKNKFKEFKFFASIKIYLN